MIPHTLLDSGVVLRNPSLHFVSTLVSQSLFISAPILVLTANSAPPPQYLQHSAWVDFWNIEDLMLLSQHPAVFHGMTLTPFFH